MLDLPIEVFCEHVHKSCLSMELTAQCCPALEPTKASGKNRRAENGPSLLARENFIELREAADRHNSLASQNPSDEKELCRELCRLTEALDKYLANIKTLSGGAPRFRPPNAVGDAATHIFAGRPG